MVLNAKLLEEIAYIFSCVEYGIITFYINPESKTFNYRVETTHHIPMEEIGTPATAERRKAVIRRKPSGEKL